MQNPGVAILCLKLCLFWMLAGVSLEEARRRGDGERRGDVKGSTGNWLSLSRRGHHRYRLPCPTRRCRCYRKFGTMHLKCSSNHEVLENIPYFRPFNITFDSIALANHNLTHVPNDAFVNVLVSHLDLSGNLLEEGVNDYAFRGQEANLQVLDLSNCRLSEVPTFSLKRLTSLSVLRLNDNLIRHLPRNAFKHNTNLKDLALYRNLISVITPASLTGLSNLQNLKLFRNDIKVLSRRMFRKLVSLTSLDLSWNQIETVQSGSLRPLSRLTWLDLSYNFIKQLTGRTFKGIKKLKYLNLDHNALENIRDEAFEPVRRLKYLSLDINTTQVSNSTFRGLTKLQHLYLGDVKRSSLPGGIFSDMAELKFLSLSDYGDVFDGLTTSMFARDLHLEELSIWTVPVHKCSCSTPWIHALVRKGAFLHGYCPDGRPISCKRRRKGVKRNPIKHNYKGRRRKDEDEKEKNEDSITPNKR